MKRAHCVCLRRWAPGGSALQRARHPRPLAGTRSLALPRRVARRPFADHSAGVRATPGACMRMGQAPCRAARLQEEAQLQAPIVLEVVVCPHPLVHHLRACQPALSQCDTGGQSSSASLRPRAAAGRSMCGGSTACGAHCAAAAGLQTGAGGAGSPMRSGTLHSMRGNTLAPRGRQARVRGAPSCTAGTTGAPARAAARPAPRRAAPRSRRRSLGPGTCTSVHRCWQEDG